MRNYVFILLFLLSIIDLKGQTQECRVLGLNENILQDYGIQSSFGGGENRIVKLYYLVYSDGLGFGGVDAARVNDIHEALNNYFLGTGISFYYAPCETEFIPNQDLHNSNDICDFINPTRHTDGIDIHVKGDGNSYWAQSSWQPGDEILISGMQGETPAALSSSIAHEMGHCLGLFHTHQGTCFAIYEDCFGNEAAYGDPLTNDFVSDTPPDPGELYNNTCIYNPNGEICDDNNGHLYHPLTNNFMSYFKYFCRNSFTPGQITRMYYTMLPEVIYNGSPANCGCDNLEIFSTFELNQNSTYRSIIIKPNGTLILNNANFKFVDEIVIEFGGKLIVDGATLTSCQNNLKWKGIKAWGNPFSGQTHAVELKNGAIIENAEIGINTSNIVNGGLFGPQFDLSGAKVTVESNSIIRNCDIGINFGPYGYSGPYFSWNDASYIQNSIFADCNIGVKLRSNLGVDILNSDFLGISTSGVEIINSQVEVSGCEFEGTTGVFFGATWPSLLGSTIKVNNFLTSVEGVLLDAQGNATEHSIGGNLFASGNGISAYGQSTFNIQNNEFGDNYVSLSTWFTGDDNNLVTDNSFNLHIYGSSVYGPNNNEYNNNCFENGITADIELNDGASIFDQQGDFENAAGNCFTKTVSSFITGIDAESFTYFIKTGTLPQSCKYPIGGIWDLGNSSDEEPLNCGFGFWGNIPPRYRNCVIPSTLTDKKAMEIALKAEIQRIKGDPNISPLVKKWLIARYERCLKRLIGKIVEDIIKTPNTGREDAVSYLSTQELFSHRIMAYSLMIEAGDYPSAEVYLNGLATNRNAESDFVTAQNIYLDYLQQGTSYVLNAQDTTLLGNIAREENELSGYARTIYYEMTGNKIKLSMPHLPLSGSRPVSQENYELSKVLLYPNPVDDLQFTLIVAEEFIRDKCTMQISDVTGNMIMNNTLNTENTLVDVSSLRSGIYFVKVSNQQQILFTGKLIRL